MKGRTPEATLSAQLYTAAKTGKPVTTVDGTERRHREDRAGAACCIPREAQRPART